MINPIKGHIYIHDNGDGTGIILEVPEDGSALNCKMGDNINFEKGIKTRSKLFDWGEKFKIIHYTDLKNG